MARAHIALGSNIAPRKFFLSSAIKKINREKGIAVKRRSSIYDTYPLGGPPQERYLNNVIEVETSLKPRELLFKLLHIEKSLGRIRRGKNSPRTIDLDVLLYEDFIAHSRDISIPHPRLHKRDFVMAGLSEISPTVVHPILKATIGDIYGRRQMKVIRGPNKAYKCVTSLKRKGKRIGFVPTMGYLHEGHFSLIRKARRENDVVVVSIFVNPAQFGPREDFKRYPRDFVRDRALAKKNGVDIIFYPAIKDVYPPGHSTCVSVEGISENLCGRFRPGHFRGVATIVTKLLNIIPPDNAYFGQKDAQQAFMIKKMARELDIPAKIKILPIVREKDGLAMSSRNIYLNKRQRREAVAISRSLLLAKSMIKSGERNSKKIIKNMKSLVKRESSARIEYISIVDTERLRDIKLLKGKVLIAVAAYFGEIRLIDNVIITIKRK